MIKKIIFGLATVAALASCNGDYDDWASPQANPQKDAAEKFVMTVQPAVSSIDFETEAAESIQLFSTNLAEGQTEAFNVTLTGADNGTSAAIAATPQGYVAAADLQGAVAAIYGKAPVERAFNVTVDANVKVTTENGSVQADKTGIPFQLSVKLLAPYISEHYYIIGAPSAWTPNEKSLPFMHSDKGVYDDPVFTVVFPIAADGDTWFAIADDKVADENDWANVYGCVEGNGNNGLEGHLARRSELTDDGSFMIPAGSGSYAKMTINMMDCTYRIEYLNYSAYIYEVGNNNGWNDSACYPLAGLDYDGKYRGFAWLDGEFKFKPTNSGWDGDWEFASGDFSAGTLTDGGSNIPAPATPGFYMMEVDLGTMQYKNTPIETIGLIGSATAGGWDTSTPMTYNSADNSWNITADFTDGAFKFRANNGWDINWGGSTDDVRFNSGDIPVAAGNYTIKLVVTADGMNTCTMTKN